jgi:hypothetical protein
MKAYLTDGGTWCNNQAEWKEKSIAEGVDVKGRTPTLVEVPTNPKEALVAFLNKLSTPPATPAVSVSVSATDTTMSLDERVKGAPLRQRLDWAVDAIDDATSMLGRMATQLRKESGS